MSESDQQPEHLNAAQMAEVQRHLVVMVEKMQLRKWALEQCLKNAVAPDRVVQLARAMTDFVEGKAATTFEHQAVLADGSKISQAEYTRRAFVHRQEVQDIK